MNQRWTAVALAACALGLLISLSAFSAGSSARASIAVTRSTVLSPAPSQPDPLNLWNSTPIPAVEAAAHAAQVNAPLPLVLTPSIGSLASAPPGFSPTCSPKFGPGIEPRSVCFLGDSSSSTVVAVIGDSHAGRWIPALAAIGQQEGFAVVPLGKAGCQLNVYDRNSAEWPCGTWYRWALAEDRKLHPIATVVTFLLKTDLQAEPVSTVSWLKTILGQVTNGVYLADPPYQTQFPAACLSAAGATMGTCVSRVPSSYAPLMRDVQRMTYRTHHPAIPTLQWLCADGICPMVINGTITTSDRSHLTVDYSVDLSGVLGLALKPILADFEAKRARGESIGDAGGIRGGGRSGLR
jgi:hypothetical protein